MNLIVTNIPGTVNEEKLKALFARYGTVQSVHISQDRFDNQAQGLVVMGNLASGIAAIRALDGTTIDGNEIKVMKKVVTEERLK